MTYSGFNDGVDKGIRQFIKLMVREFVLMEKRSDGILLNKGQVDFLKTWIKSEKNIKAFIKEVNKNIK